MGRNLEFKGSGKFLEIGRSGGKTTVGRNAELGIRYGFQPRSVYGDARAEDGWSALGGSAGAGINLSATDPLLGAYAEGYVFRAQGDTLLAGDERLGVTAAGGVNALSLEGQAGYNPKEKTFGATIGGKLVTVEGGVGVNVAGVNVGVNAEVGLKAELGFKIGKKTELKLPFITLGLSFGGARK